MKVFTHGLLLGMVFVLVAQNIESPAVKLPTDTLPVDYDRVTWAFWKHVFFCLSFCWRYHRRRVCCFGGSTASRTRTT